VPPLRPLRPFVGNEAPPPPRQIEDTMTHSETIGVVVIAGVIVVAVLALIFAI
jgi:hypothetical protein